MATSVKKLIDATDDAQCELEAKKVDFDPGEKERLEQELLLSAESWKTMEQAETVIAHLRSELDAATATNRERSTNLATSEAEIKAVRASLETKVGESEFADVDAVRAALIEEKSLAELIAARTALENRLSESAGELKTVTSAILRLREQKSPEQKELIARRERLDEQPLELDSLKKQLTELELRVRTDDQNRKRRKERQQEIQQEYRQLESWRKLKGLIGSADGKKFSRFRTRSISGRPGATGEQAFDETDRTISLAAGGGRATGLGDLRSASSRDATTNEESLWRREFLWPVWHWR